MSCALRGLLRPAQCTNSGYRLYDAQAPARLRVARAASEAGIGRSEITRLCHVLDSGAGECLARLRSLIAARHETLAVLDRQLARMACDVHLHAEAEGYHA
jgi:MerR family mercuric resistance operon transcriptional regulator